MGRDRLRVLGLAIAYLVTVVPSLFLHWFEIDLGIDSIGIDLRNGGGLYESLATSAFWGSLVVMIPAVGFQTFTRLTSGIANAKLTRYGIYIGLSLLTSGLLAGYLFAPEIPTDLAGLGPEVQRTIAPLLFIAANALGIAALHYAATETTDDDVGAYKPVVIDKPITRAPTSPIAPIAKPITRPPTGQIVPLEIEEKVPTPQGTPSLSVPPIPGHMRKKLHFVVLSGEVTRAGIDARREDGSSLLVLWRDVVGVVVRRLPDELDATTFMDIVSVKGSTLRIVPWTRLTGISVVGVGDDRMRSLSSYVATMCSNAQLFDPATKTFLEKGEPAAQLKDVAKLAAHDERLS